jgi:hypothetical protein
VGVSERRIRDTQPSLSSDFGSERCGTEFTQSIARTGRWRTRRVDCRELDQRVEHTNAFTVGAIYCCFREVGQDLGASILARSGRQKVRAFVDERGREVTRDEGRFLE